MENCRFIKTLLQNLIEKRKNNISNVWRFFFLKYTYFNNMYTTKYKRFSNPSQFSNHEKVFFFFLMCCLKFLGFKTNH